ncbi:hypothetical protein HYX70_02080 [Candidatus Saccharibacteria bacterium]|nr:hypothetical protein [Candidatus Saccharibacteria bacterium]
MQKELKIRVNDPHKIEAKLKSLGCPLSKERTSTYTYFNQPDDRILKISENERGSFLIVMEKVHGKFVIKSKDVIQDLEQTLANLDEKFGLKRIIINRRKFFKHPQMKISLNNIKVVGNFLILKGKNPKIEFVTKELGIKNPEIVTSSFDNL